MKYSDFEKIESDKFTGLIFGNKGQLQIIGYSGSIKNKRIHIVKCNICAEDQELYGDGIFTAFIKHLRRGSMPCGCAPKKFYSKCEYEILMSRKLFPRNYTFISWVDSYDQPNPKVLIKCPEHDPKEVKAREVIQRRFGCRVCALCHPARKKTFEEKVKQLYDLQFYAEGTIFSIDQNPRNPEYNYWKVYCPDCDTEYSAIFNNLLRLKKGCACVSDTRYAYILEISDEQGPVALKFGISCNPMERHKRIQLSSDFNLHTIGIYEFPDVNSCRTAEYTCKRMLSTGVLSKQELNDGYTETTHLKNLENIRSIYSIHGGKEVTAHFYSEVIGKVLESTKQKISMLIPKLDENYVEIKNRLMYIVGKVKDDTKAESVQSTAETNLHAERFTKLLGEI